MTLPAAGDASYFLDLYARYLRDPAAVPADWRCHFATLDGGGPGTADAALLAESLLSAYRRSGHRQAALDPLGLRPRAASPEIAAVRRRLGRGTLRLVLGGQDLVLDPAAAAARLDAIYAGSAAIEAAHVADPDDQAWLYDRFEREIAAVPDDALLARTLEAVLLADAFERFFRTKWPTSKRFGIEGAESATVILRETLRSAAAHGCREVVIGGMHRGRLATLATVLGKSLPALIAEVKGRDSSGGDAGFTGDVPYHNGLAAPFDSGIGVLDVRLLPHPSHLTVVAAVALGAARARQERRADADRGGTVLPLLMHTDAAFAGQGLVSELFQLAGLDGYRVGGSIHLVVNNQIGFTTPPEEGRSAPCATDIGKAFGVPILHVNGDDPIAAAALARVAVAWRNRSGRDAIIDLVCYRRNGHNELDEPRFTQPRTWAAIDAHPALPAAYAALVRARSLSAYAAAEARRQHFHAALDAAFATADRVRPDRAAGETDVFAAATTQPAAARQAPTGIDRDRLMALAQTICAIPDGIDPDPKVRNFLRARLDSIERDSGFNMATAEALCFASLLADGTSVRLSGQDSVRGTFTQRHLTLHDRTSGRTATPLAAAARGKARFDAINSPLSEYGVLGFEYGFSLADADRLVIWEAQFGDFLNGAQVVVDQYIATAEAKWRLRSGLVIALPHGLEGQGPDHSSARIERILQACAGDNIIVANPSSPANLFHLLRRQARDPRRKPLFLIAPKSLLRDRNCTSRIADIAPGTAFRPLLVRPPTVAPCRRVVLCSGKICYALDAALARSGVADVAVVRVEQLYPFPAAEIAETLARLAGAMPVWCQEEPRNQGAWSFVREQLAGIMPAIAPSYAGRPPMAAAAGGSIDRHDSEQAAIVAAALQIAPAEGMAALPRRG